VLQNFSIFLEFSAQTVTSRTEYRMPIKSAPLDIDRSRSAVEVGRSGRWWQATDEDAVERDSTGSHTANVIGMLFTSTGRPLRQSLRTRKHLLSRHALRLLHT
jgi:hypothetical protein